MLAKLKAALPYIIGVLLLLGSMLAKGIIKRQQKQQQAELRQQQQEQRMEALKASLEELEDSNTTVRAQAVQ